ncbi:MAG: hypothetical protein K2J15_06475, partial [Muribaculaceae bacterium]|nr:hypothetical protein [Muribaculaceae bacterium]
INANGKKAIKIREDDELLQVSLTDGDSNIILANREGRAVRFHESKVRPVSRDSMGVIGMTLGSESDEVVGMISLNADSEDTVMVVSANGYGKRSDLKDYPTHNRGGKGVMTISITEKTGQLVAIKNVNDDNDLVIINKSGITLRLAVKDIRVMGRATQGVKLIDLSKRGDEIASVCKVDSDPGKDVEEEADQEIAEISRQQNEETIEAISDAMQHAEQQQIEDHLDVLDHEILPDQTEETDIEISEE